MAAPLFITLMAVLILGEKVSPARWLAVATGFAGVLLIVQPTGDAFNAWALLCLLGTLANAGRDLVTRTIDKRVPSILITLATAVAVTLLAGAWTVLQGWQPPSTWQLAQLAAASVFLNGGYYLIFVGMREGEMSVIARGYVFACGRRPVHPAQRTQPRPRGAGCRPRLEAIFGRKSTASPCKVYASCYTKNSNMPPITWQ